MIRKGRDAGVPLVRNPGEGIQFAERAIEKGKKDAPADQVTVMEKQVAELKAKK